ncbi:lipopolysaccharide assembly protein LapB [uncultured Desulfovibrio sp.]|uniref:tetratricopeptide repeat protein n=1 Tax=uncultured Desulfovibrio sp. TaxID=167968 RepID=UPI002626B9B7|nr:tetratricopeptide repeat protein [uncultured Desulfovibrio sp.]
MDDSAKSGLVKRIQVRQIQQTMEKAVAESKQQDKAYGEVVIEYLRDNGQVICISDDNAFTDMLREVVYTRLKMPAGCLTISSNADMLLHTVRQLVAAEKKPLLLVEQNLRNRDMTYMLRQLKNGFPELWSIIVTHEVNKQRFVLLHESGVDNCIVKPVGAQALLEKVALTIRPQGKVERKLEWARGLLGQGEHLRALQVCKEALEVKSNSAAALLLIGDIFRAMQQYDKACEAYENASRTSSMFLEPLRKLAEVHAETGNASKRLACLERLDELSPLNVERKLAIGELYLKLNRPDKAKKMFDQAIHLSDREAREYVSSVAFRVADVYMDKDPQTAAVFLQRGLEGKKGFWGPEDLIIFNRLGILLRRAGKWREAAEEYRKALQVAPNDEKLHYNLGMAYLEGKDFESARASILKALALNPDLPRKSALVAVNLATVFVQTGDNMHALPLLRQALEQDPENSTAKEMLEQIGQND